MFALLLSAATTGLFHPTFADPLVAENPFQAVQLYRERTRLSDLLRRVGAAGPFLAPQRQRFTDDPTTNLAIELQMELVRTIELSEQLMPEHPALAVQRVRLRTLSRALDAMRRKGFRANPRRIRAEMNDLLSRAQAELSLASETYTEAHPAMPALRLRVRAVQQIARSRR